MKIHSIYLEHFGKFQKKKYELGEGINLVYGKNESGKSTINRFIRAMFYGIERGRGRSATNDDYEKFKPWESMGAYSGNMEISVGEKKYRLYRNFLTAEKDFRIIDLETGREVSPEQFAGMMGLPSEQAFKEMYGTRYAGEFAGDVLENEVRNYLTNLEMTKTEEINIKAALAKLSDRIKEIDRRTKRQNLTEVQSRLMENDQCEAEYKKVKDNFDKNNADLDELEKRHRKIADYVDNLNKCLTSDKLFGIYMGKLKERGIDTNDEGYMKLAERKEEIDRIRDDEKMIVSRMNIAYAIAFVGMIAAILLKDHAGLIGGVSVFMAVFAFVCKMVSYKRSGSLDKEYARINQEYNEWRAELIRRHCEKYNSECASLELAIREKIALCERFKWEMNRLEERMLENDILADKEKKIKEVLAAEGEERAAAVLALDTLNSVSEGIYNDFGVNFNRQFSKNVSELTLGKYSKLTADDGMNIRVDMEDRHIQSINVSDGTREQFYLALKATIADILDEDKKLPLILDDCFGNYDDDRLKGTFKWLSKRQRQIIVFSCTEREKSVMDMEDIPYNLICL